MKRRFCVINEGEKIGPFITVQRISDGGFALHVSLFGRRLYVRRRGPRCLVKNPRYVITIDRMADYDESFS